MGVPVASEQLTQTSPEVASAVASFPELDAVYGTKRSEVLNAFTRAADQLDAAVPAAAPQVSTASEALLGSQQTAQELFKLFAA